MLLLRHPKTESRLQQRHELVSNCCRKQKTGLFRIIRVLQISCYSSVAMGYCTWKEKHVRGKNIMRELTFCLCLAFLHHMEHVSVSDTTRRDFIAFWCCSFQNLQQSTLPAAFIHRFLEQTLYIYPKGFPRHLRNLLYHWQ